MDETDIEHIAPLGDDNIPDANQSHYCFSCEAPINGLYCAGCGQKNDDYRRSLFGLGWETIASMLALEHRMWRTWWNLFRRPGRVAREFVHGKRTVWTSPVRVYLFTSIVLFTTMALTQTHIFSFDLQANQVSGFDLPKEELTEKNYSVQAKFRMFDRQSAIDKRNENKDYEMIDAVLNRTFGDGNIYSNFGNFNGNNNTDDSGESLIIEDGTVKLTNTSGETKTVKTGDFIPVISQVFQNPAVLNRGIKTWLPRIMFIMMPFAMLLGAIFIRGKDALLYDHLVHAAYVHGVAFAVLFVIIMIAPLWAGIGWLFPIFFLIYLPLSLKTMFRRGWFKSVFASYAVGLTYLLTITFVVLTFAIVSIINYVDDNVESRASGPDPQTTIESPQLPQTQPPQ